MDISIISNLAASAGGALAGAFAAFLLERNRRKNERSDSERSKLLNAQFILAQKINSIINLKNALDQIPLQTNPAAVRQMIYITIDDALSSRDLEPMIDGQWSDHAAEILRCDRAYADAVEWLTRFNQQKDRIESNPNSKRLNVDLKKGEGEVAIDPFVFVGIDLAFKNLRESVDQAHGKLPVALDSLRAFIREKYPGRMTISISPKHQKG